MDVCFVELLAFTEEVTRLAGEETLRQFQMELAGESRERRLDSAFGRVAQGSNEIARARQKFGRAGDLPVVAAHAMFRLFMLYTKARQADIPPAILARLRMAVETIKARYNR